MENLWPWARWGDAVTAPTWDKEKREAAKKKEVLGQELGNVITLYFQELMTQPPTVHLTDGHED